jgi:hypothetical protein
MYPLKAGWTPEWCTLGDEEEFSAHIKTLNPVTHLKYWVLLPKFAGSNPAEAVGFLRVEKSSECLPSEGKKSRGSHVADLRHVKDP